jgi:predicted DNA-binding transcriptional regulator AlpA
MSRKLFLTPKELTERWVGSVSVRTLANWRSYGDGPRFVKLGGRVAYKVTDVEEWERSRGAQSTSEYM